MKFDNLEDLMRKYPIDNKHNRLYRVEEYRIFCPTSQDLIEEKNLHPFGYFNKAEGRYYYCNISSYPWYNYYIFDGTYWYLGLNNWDGVLQVKEEPEYRIINRYNGLLVASLKTEEEAYECVKKRYSTEEVCRF